MTNEYNFTKCLSQNIYNPLTELDETWLIHDETIQNLRLFKNWRENHNLNKWFSQINRFDSLENDSFNTLGSKIVLMRKEDLLIILLHLGTLLHHQILNSVGIVSEKNKLINIIGNDMYKFCLNQGKYLLNEWPDGWGISSFKTFSYEYIVGSGLNFVLSILKECDNRIIKLIQFKLPYEYIDSFTNENEIDTQSHSNLAYHLIVKLTKRVHPSCYHFLK